MATSRMAVMQKGPHASSAFASNEDLCLRRFLHGTCASITLCTKTTPARATIRCSTTASASATIQVTSLIAPLQFHRDSQSAEDLGLEDNEGISTTFLCVCSKMRFGVSAPYAVVPPPPRADPRTIMRARQFPLQTP